MSAILRSQPAGLAVAIAYLLVPYAELRVFLLFAGLWWLHRRTLSGSTPTLRLAVAGVFAIHFLLLPYWSLRFALPLGLTLISLTFIVFTTAVADAEVGSPVELDSRPTAIFLLAALALNGAALYAGIPFRGDTSHHLSTMMQLSRSGGPIAIGVAAFVIIGRFYRRDPGRRWLMVAGASALLVGLIQWGLKPGAFEYIERYPVAYHLGHLAISFSPLAQPATGLLYQEVLHRLPALLAFSLSAAACVHLSGSRPGGWILGATMLTLPVVHYYSTLVYIEPFMVLCATIVIVRFETDFRRFMESGTLGLGVLALACLSLLKETAIIFVCAALAAATVELLRRRRSFNALRLLKWSALVVLPCLTFLIFRDPEGRPMDLQTDRLFRGDLLWALALSWGQQLGPLSIAGGVAWCFALGRRHWGLAAFTGVAAVGFSALQLVDGDYVGHSRFSLPLVPLLVGPLIVMLKEARDRITGPVLAAVVVYNVLSSPVSVLTGAREPGWGDVLTPTSEFDTPYRELFRWLKQSGSRDACIVGRSFGYPDEFYFRQLGLRMERFAAPVGTLEPGFFETAYELCVVHRNLFHERPDVARRLLEPQPRVQLPSGYTLERVFERGAIRLEVYRRSGPM
ncbi:MAG: hypothetical protein AAFX94_00990 [Myxococcota bacterium]